MSDTVKFLLGEPDIPTHWVNLMADLSSGPPAPPPLHPGTGEPAGPDDLAPLFPMNLILQEVSAEPDIEIPDRVRDAYKLWRPTPLHRARTGWNGRSIRPRTSTTSTRGPRRPGRTSRTRRLPRRTRTRRPASRS